MRDDDVVAPTHRDMGIFLIRGISVRRIIAQYMGRATGVTKGKDGNMHMGDLNHNLIAFVSHLGDNVPVAAGVCHSPSRHAAKTVWRSATTGEGATSRGDWHEGVNFAGVHDLPIVFFINNNEYAYSTPQSTLQMPVKDVADRALGYNDAVTKIIDGNDAVRRVRCRRATRSGPCTHRQRPVPGRVPDVSHDGSLGARRRGLCTERAFH